MPYRHAWLLIAALIAATVFGFWRTYFGMLSHATPGFHIHGVTASFWMLLLLAQSYTPHRGRMGMHRTAGRVTFVAMPLFAAGSMGVVHSMAVGTVGGDPFYALWGASLAFLDLLALGAVLYATGMALRHRRAVRLHAGYMLSTALPLVSPALGRVVNRTVPGLTVHGPDDFPLFGWSVQLANVIAALIALWLWRRDTRAGRPWAVAFVVVAAQIVGFQTVATSHAWRAVCVAVAAQPLATTMAFGLMAGAAAVYVGWSSGSISRRTPPPATA